MVQNVFGLKQCSSWTFFLLCGKSQWHSQNLFCYVSYKKSTPRFKKQIKNVFTCTQSCPEMWITPIFYMPGLIYHVSLYVKAPRETCWDKRAGKTIHSQWKWWSYSQLTIWYVSRVERHSSVCLKEIMLTCKQTSENTNVTVHNDY